MLDCFIIDPVKIKKPAIFLFKILVGMGLILGCSTTSEYDKLVKTQLESGVKNDTIFLGVHFGMTYGEYYGHITHLGYQGIVSQGGDMSALHEIKDFDTTINMNFVPKYINDSIQEMQVSYRYFNWAPWNKRTTDERLWKDVQQLYKDRYGKDFITLASQRSIRPVLVWVKGNQRIMLFQQQEGKVNATISNLNKNTDQANTL